MRQRGAAAVAALGTAALAGAAFVLRRWDPMRVAWYPRCPSFVLTGLYCPGCGALRAGHALLHGRLDDALGFNALLVLAGPVLAYVAIRMALRWAGGPSLPGRRPSGPETWAILALVVGFMVLRNLPWAPFAALAP